jgi:hypothetical protein
LSPGCGCDEVVVISVDEFRRLKGDLTGETLIAEMQASPDRHIDLAPARGRWSRGMLAIMRALVFGV